MRIDIVSVFPEIIEGAIQNSIMKRVREKGLVEFHLHNLRDYSLDKHRRVDDYPFGGEAGMVMQIEPIDRIISHLKSQREYDEVIFTSPDGETFTQSTANELSLMKNLIILCGHYKGVDYRVREHLVTRELSIGDFVLTGGELVAAMIADAVVRVIPGAIGDEQSASPIRFRMGCWRPYIPARRSTKGGRCPRCCCRVMSVKLPSGGMNSRSNRQKSVGRLLQEY